MRPQDVRRARETPGLSPAERLTLETLTDYASYEKGVFIPRPDLARKTGLHPKTVQHAIRRLVALGYVDEMKRAQPGQIRTLMPRPDRWPSLTLEAEAPPRHDGTDQGQGGHSDAGDDAPPDEPSALGALGW